MPLMAILCISHKRVQRPLGLGNLKMGSKMDHKMALLWPQVGPEAASASLLAAFGGPGFQVALGNLKMGPKMGTKMALLWPQVAPEAASASLLAAFGGPGFQVDLVDLKTGPKMGNKMVCLWPQVAPEAASGSPREPLGSPGSFWEPLEPLWTTFWSLFGPLLVAILGLMALV